MLAARIQKLAAKNQKLAAKIRITTPDISYESNSPEGDSR
jgi:hypothetical protein